MGDLGSFISDFLGKDALDSPPRASGGIVAVAQDNSRQIVGNIINNYYSELPGTTQLGQEWLKTQEWLNPSAQALNTQTSLDRDARNNRARGTCSWFLNSDGFQQWLQGSKRLEWIHSAIGRGKTTLFAAAVRETQQVCFENTSKRACYFYCTARDPSGQDITTLLRFLLIQLCQPPTPHKSIAKLYDQCHAVYPPSIPTTEDLIDALVQTLQDLLCDSNDSPATHVYIMIDGLDEIPFESADRQAILDFLYELSALCMQNVGLFVTSRDQPDIQEAFTSPIEWNQTALDPNAIQYDIETYISVFMEKSRRFRHLLPEIQQSIKETIGGKARGMFLWSALQLQYLSRLRVLTAASVSKALSSLPPDLDTTYRRLLSEIDETCIPDATRALMWLAFSARTLYIEELIDACAADLKRAPQQILGPRVTAFELFEMLHDLVSIEPPLASRDCALGQRTHTISLCHASVVDFLQQRDDGGRLGSFPRKHELFINKGISDLLIARTCLAYLFQYNTSGANTGDHPLLNYAWHQWDRHVHSQGLSTDPGIDNDEYRRVAIDIYSKLSRTVIEVPKASEVTTQPERSDTAQDFVSKYLSWVPASDWFRVLESLRSPRFLPELGSPSNMSKELCPFPLDFPETQIRLLELFPCLDVDTPIQGRLVKRNLGDRPRYVVLSWVWGSLDNGEIAIVDGHALMLPGTAANLLKFLRSRRDGAISMFWLDYLCIHRTNKMEKRPQLKIIPQIFKQAQETIVSLGPEAPATNTGSSQITRVLRDDIIKNTGLSQKTHVFRGDSIIKLDQPWI